MTKVRHKGLSDIVYVYHRFSCRKMPLTTLLTKFYFDIVNDPKKERSCITTYVRIRLGMYRFVFDQAAGHGGQSLRTGNSTMNF